MSNKKKAEAAMLLPFGGRFFRPSRPRLVAAMAAITNLDEDLVREIVEAEQWSWSDARGFEWVTNAPAREGQGGLLQFTGKLKEMVRSPAEAWETLLARGVLPESWASGPRSFVMSNDRTMPVDVLACLSVATDPEGMEQAERYALEVRDRLAPFGTGKGARIVWKVVGEDDERYFYLQPPRPAAEGAWPLGGPLVWMALAIGSDPLTVPRPVQRRGQWVPPVVEVPKQPLLGRHSLGGVAPLNQAMALEAAITQWRAAGPSARYSAAVRIAGNDVAVPLAVQGQSVGELGDWVEPLEAIYALGYGMEWISKRAITLLAPEVERKGATEYVPPR